MLQLKKGITVVVCCYNSAARLSETIRHLALQGIGAEINWEVIIVNNASTDNTVTVAINEAAKYATLSSRFNIINQRKAGLIYARQSGAQLAKYSYLIFCDDDNWLNEDYIINAFHIMENNHKIGALGGISTALTDAAEFPEWFENLQHGYAVGKQSNYEGNISKTGILWGAGLVTRTSLFNECFSAEFPSIFTGRKGDQLSSGEDTEYCMRVLLKGFELHYYECLSFVHFITKSRWSIEYFKRLELAIQHGVNDGAEMNKYTLLFKLKTTNVFLRPILVLKTIAGYISSKIVSRKSWSLGDIIVLIFFWTGRDLGIDENTRMIFAFYKNNCINYEKQHIRD